MVKRTVIISIFLCLVILSACGKKARPLPPNVKVPNPPDSISVESSPEGATLLIKLPNKKSDGTGFDDLKGIEVFRAHVVDESSFCKNCDDNYKLIYRGSADKAKNGYVSFSDKDVDLKGLYYYKVRVAGRENGISGFSAPVKLDRTN